MRVHSDTPMRRWWGVVTAVLLLLASMMIIVSPVVTNAAEAEGTAKTEETSTTTATTSTTTTPDDNDDDFDVSNSDWGSYYDPKNIFCGPYDCYQILGFDYETFGQPAKKQITQRYRKLSRAWHPDKSKFPNAKERFVQIARAYEVLTTQKTREEYDSLRYDQEAYFRKYGSSVLWNYAPKTDTSVVLLILLCVANVISWTTQQHRWNLVANRLIQAASEDWSVREGGSAESQQLRAQALEQLQQAAAAAAQKESADPSSTPTKKKQAKLSARDRKKQEQEQLKPIVKQLVHQMDDFGAGFHKPTFRDLLLYKCIFTWPLAFVQNTLWQTGYWIRRMRGVALNEDEQNVLTERSVGYVLWTASTPEERVALVQRELWRTENFKEWSEEQEIKKLPSAQQKYYQKAKKKGKLE